MGKKRVRHSAEFKAKVALEALKGLQTVNELAGQYQVHPAQISQWKRQVQKGEPKTCLRADRERGRKRLKPFKRSCTKKLVA
jgi:transposase-like protein